MIFAGLDIGSVFSKAVLLDDGRIITFHIFPSKGNYSGAAEVVLKECLAKAGITLSDLSGIVATGVGAGRIPYQAKEAGDISCHCKGINYYFPQARTVIEIGGQSSKVARIDNQGRVLDFAISEKCAAGSGRFLQIIARILDITVEEIGPLSLRSKSPVEFSTSCAVFAESETVSRIAEGASREDILAGVHRAVAAKILSLVRRVRLQEKCALTGGAAKDTGLVKYVAEALNTELLVPEEPSLTAAVGAACLATEKAKTAQM